ncbi:hypothetical protein Tco_0340448 [Tanacetum coccineum]
MPEKGNYIPWESRFRRFLDKKLEDKERMVMNYLLQAIPNDIYNSVDACKNAKEMWERIKRLMFGSEVTSHVRHSRLMDEFDKFAAKEGESLEIVSIMRMLRLKEVARKIIGMHWRFVMSFVRVWCMDSLNAIDFISSLISLNRGSFDVIVGMDWLSKRKFVIVCHEKVVRIPLEGDEILRVHGERTQGVVKTLVNTKTRVSYDLVIFHEEHQCRLLRREAWSSFEVSVGITKEGEVVC